VATVFVCIFPGCHGHNGDQIAAVLHGQQALARDLRAIKRALGIIQTEQEHIMSEQDDINSAVATDTALITDLSTQVTAVQAAQAAFAAEIATLEAGGVDTSGLVAINEQLAAAQAPLDAAVQALTAASVPAAPAE
jgi:chromosome segregation ATPase